MYNHNKAQQSKNRVHISWDILYETEVVEFLTIISYRIVSYPIISYPIQSYHILSYHITSLHISCHVISYHISCNIVSYRTVLYGIVSYHIISNHIIYQIIAYWWPFCHVITSTMCHLVLYYSTGVQIVSCTLSSDSVLSDSTGLFNPVLSVSANEIAFDKKLANQSVSFNWC